MTKVTVSEVISVDRSVNVKIVHVAKLAEVADKLINMSDDGFRGVVKVARKYHRANLYLKRLTSEDSTTKIEFNSDNNELLNQLTEFSYEDFRSVIKCAKKYRRISKALDDAENSYSKLKEADLTARMAYAG
ncbi:MAG: hypothetical protein Q4E47_01250 [Candidatus Saccharibacteria bacterium]|nr:hypothetical protein [Candidatus Saccharibacteria bacterium]